MKKNGVHIMDVLPSSIAHELGIEKGDIILSINSEKIKDILEYKYVICDEYLEIEIMKKDGEIWEYEIEKDYDEDLGIIFEGIIDEPKSCHNKCIFCFIDQLPKGMRKTLYFKDDDTRLSFLQGNFVTLTNLSKEDINKIIKYRISPINVSVHTTNLDLRKKMLNNKNANRLIEYLDLLHKGSIEVKAQIVLCPGVNDRDELSKTLQDLSKYYPQLSCVAVVPVGLTKHREGLIDLKEFDEFEASNTVQQITALQKDYLERYGTRFVHLSDEFYLLGNIDLPNYESYEDFSQLENGVGLIALFKRNVEDSLLIKMDYKSSKALKGTIATGIYAQPYVSEALDNIKKVYMKLDIQIFSIINNFFGSKIKVAGLITGKDLIDQLKTTDVGEYLFITESMLKQDERVFLDDITIEDVERELNVIVIICKEDGSDLVNNIIKLS